MPGGALRTCFADDCKFMHKCTFVYPDGKVCDSPLHGLRDHKDTPTLGKLAQAPPPPPPRPQDEAAAARMDRIAKLMGK